MKPNKRSSRLLALALSLVLSLSLSLPALAAGEDGIIYIHTAKDLCALSDSCAYDAWSRGKTVLLTADISLRGVDFEPIASFSGTFNGGGHTISGLTLTDSLSPPVFSSRSSAAPSSTRSRSRAGRAGRHEGICRRHCRTQLRHDRGMLVFRRCEG
ncbi:MAG: hypothetical protein ACLR4W_03750 [Oscillospiraceae bacterium]